MKKVIITTLMVLMATSAHALTLKSLELSGEWDKEKLINGYTVVAQVCINCHSLKYISHRNFIKYGFTKDEALEMADELGLTLDEKISSNLDNETAIEVYGKEIPDLSLMVKARPNGENYLYNILTAYDEEKDDTVPEGTYYNAAFAGHAITMPAPLMEGSVYYTDDSEPTVEQMAEDVAYFLKWTATPELMERKKLGVYVLIYVLIFTLLAWGAKRSIWRRLKK